MWKVFLQKCFCKNGSEKLKWNNIVQQVGAELCQAQLPLEMIVEDGVVFGVEVEVCHCQPEWVGWWFGWWTKTILMQTSTQVEVLVGVGVELYIAVVEAGADLQYTFPDGLMTMMDY